MRRQTAAARCESNQIERLAEKMAGDAVRESFAGFTEEVRRILHAQTTPQRDDLKREARTR